MTSANFFQVQPGQSRHCT